MHTLSTHKKEYSKIVRRVYFFDGAHGVSMELKRQLQSNQIEQQNENRIIFFDSSKSIKKGIFLYLYK